MSDKESVVYKFFNETTGETYVGSTVNIARRKTDHLRALQNGTHANFKLQRAYNRDPNFVFETSKPLGSRDTALKHEQVLIDLLKNTSLSLNIAEDASAPMQNKSHSDVAKEKMSLASLGKAKSPEHANNIRLSKIGIPRPQSVKDAVSLANTGRIPSIETREKMSLAGKGRTMPPRTQEHIDKIRESRASYVQSPETIAKIRANAPLSRPVSINGVVYPSVAEAERNVGLSHRTIRDRIASDKESNSEWVYL